MTEPFGYIYRPLPPEPLELLYEKFPLKRDYPACTFWSHHPATQEEFQREIAGRHHLAHVGPFYSHKPLHIEQLKFMIANDCGYLSVTYRVGAPRWHPHLVTFPDVSIATLWKLTFTNDTYSSAIMSP